MPMMFHLRQKKTPQVQDRRGDEHLLLYAIKQNPWSAWDWDDNEFIMGNRTGITWYASIVAGSMKTEEMWGK